MRKVLTWKFAFIAVLTLLALIWVYPPSEKLKPGLDLAGGTSLIYEIDTTGMKEQDTKGLAESMITVLKRRVDPQGVRNLIWRPLGNTRFEIQMPLASKEARQAREAYEQAMRNLLSKNINVPRVLRLLTEPRDQRAEAYDKIAGGSETARGILAELADAYDQRQAARAQADEKAAALKEPEERIKAAGLDLDSVRKSIGYWITVSGDERTGMIKAYLGNNSSPEKLALLEDYAKLYSEWSAAADLLADPENGKNVLYDQAQAKLKNLVLTEEEFRQKIENPDVPRAQSIEDLKQVYPDRADQITAAVDALDKYSKYQGRLDDPKDLERILKGAGILEFRILPTYQQENSDTELLNAYVENLGLKGPKYASDSKYIWFEVEQPNEWVQRNRAGQEQTTVRDKEGRPAVVGWFGDKLYVLCSNKPSEVMLHGPEAKPWKLTDARPTQDRHGRRAIGFSLDERGGRIFSRLTTDNLDRPLCILLDEVALSAPYISSRIGSEGIIQGRFREQQVMDMVNKLKAGSLPAMLIEQPIAEKSIGPLIGAQNRDEGIRAGIIGLIAVVVVMLAYYTSAGAIADAALVLNVLIILAAMVVLRATFTLPGIAGLILTIGMSVDANVLIFERIREEQKRGASLRIAIKNGYQRAMSTILDANITTFITAAVLYWRAPEEVKGFAIVLMIGIITSMFTALFVTRATFDLLTEFGVLKGELLKWQLFKKPAINWMGLRPVMFTLSILMVGGGLLAFFTRNDAKNNKYDIEFTGGTAATIDLKKPVDIQFVRDRIKEIGEKIGDPAIAAANVYSVGGSVRERLGTQFEINTTETNKTVTTIKIPDANQMTVDTVVSRIQQAQEKVGRKLSNLIVTADKSAGGSFVVSTSQLNKSYIKEVLSEAFPAAAISEPQLDEVVNNAILTAFQDLLEIRRSLEPQIAKTEKITPQIIETTPELVDYAGGVSITCNIGETTTGAELQRRFNDLHFKPEMEKATWYDYKLLRGDFKPLEPNEVVDRFVYVSVAPEAAERQFSQGEWERFVDGETAKVLAAGQLAESLPRVTQVNPSVGAEAKTQALIAVVLSLFAIIAYIWVRFGSVRYGLAAIIALVHDVSITLGAVTACTYIAGTPIGQALLIGDFKISQVIIAALLTLIGYSLNDTIVVFDRIRENRKKAQLVPQTITDSINQTLSRTIMTSFTTFIVVLIMYIWGGENLRGFTFAIGLGIIVGTYSSIAIASPLLLLGAGRGARTAQKVNNLKKTVLVEK
jgi:SecD/SecF fusion protein